MLTVGTALQAQTDPTTTDTAKQTGVVFGAGTVNGSVKVIDNKGTIKYLQSNNGITTINNMGANGDVTTTTWQLGGTLTDDTYIDANGNTFALNGLTTAIATDAASTIVSESDGSGITESGWALLVRDEGTGETKKLLASDLISGIRVEYTQVLDAAANVAIPVTGLPVLTAGTTFAKLFVYRNGVKLRSGTDFLATADTVTITYSATDLPMFADDIIEVQYIK